MIILNNFENAKTMILFTFYLILTPTLGFSKIYDLDGSRPDSSFNVTQKFNFMLKSSRDSTDTGKFNFMSEGVEIPFEIKKVFSRWDLTIYSKEKLGHRSICLKYILDDKNENGYIVEINTESKDCLPGIRRQGNFLLNVIDQISYHLGLKKNTLIDSSQIQCPVHGEKTDLFFLHPMQKGQTWFGTKGNFPIIF
jgi:hypothetical protein